MGNYKSDAPKRMSDKSDAVIGRINLVSYYLGSFLFLMQ